MGFLKGRKAGVLFTVFGGIELVQLRIFWELSMDIGIKIANGLHYGVLNGRQILGELGGVGIALTVLNVDLEAGAFLLGLGLGHLLVQKTDLVVHPLFVINIDQLS